MENKPKSAIGEHIDRCVELYGQAFDDDMSTPPTRENYEQMRVDLMIFVGIVMALHQEPK